MARNNEIERNIDYTEDKQKLLIDIMLSSEEIYARCQNILNPKYFVSKLRPAMKFIMNYANEYRVLPKIEHLNAETGLNFTIIDNILIQHQDSFLSEIEEFCKNRALALAITDSVELIEHGNYGEVEKLVRDAILISLQSDLGTNYFEDPRERLLRIKSRNGQMTTGWKTVDDKLYGGINRGEITIWCAGSGVGKSLFLQNQSLNMVRQGLNVVYITLELSEGLTSMRIDSMLTEVGTKDIFRNLDSVEIKVKQVSFKSGLLHVKQMPQGSTVNDIKAYLKNYEIETQKRCDVLVVDYLDLLYPNNKKINPSDLFIKDKYVTEELRGLAVERNMVCLTASQLNRCLTLDTEIITNDNVKKTLGELVEGDQILGENGYVDVIKVYPIIKQPVFKITTKSGKIITASAKHMFPTDTGLKSIEQGLKIGQKLYTRCDT